MVVLLMLSTMRGTGGGLLATIVDNELVMDGGEATGEFGRLICLAGGG